MFWITFLICESALKIVSCFSLDANYNVGDRKKSAQNNNNINQSAIEIFIS